MKKIWLSSALLINFILGYGQITTVQVTPQIPNVKYEFKQITTVESVVPGKLGRSRLITTDAQNQMQEISLENFFSFVGINFGNIRNNDKVITSTITEMSSTGWELINVNTGVYAADKSTGIFITRYLFRKPI